MDMGRIFLHNYFSSKDAGVIQEEEELSKLLARIWEVDREEFDCEDEENYVENDDDEDDEEFLVVMDEFNLLLDDSSILSKQPTNGEDVTKHRASSIHTTTELYWSANRVYYLHKERKKLVTGLRAGEAQLRLGKKIAADGLGLIGGVL